MVSKGTWPATGHDGAVEEPPARIVLGSWPTPIEPAPRLARAVGLEAGALWLKRDDLSGLGAGGNKVRKLEYLLAEARDQSVDVVVTSGRPQSNHARVTAAAACRLGLRSVLVLAGAPEATPRGNLLLDLLFGAEIVWAGPVGDRELDERVAETAATLEADGLRVAVIPLGGSSPLGARGYLDCGRELETQLPGLRHVVVALGTGGTLAGLVAALGPERVLGIDVGATEDPLARVVSLLEGLGRPCPLEALRARVDQAGAGYGLLTPDAAAAMQAAAALEGILLDPVYTAKALSGLRAAVHDGDINPDEPTVFVHTGGLPGLFGHELAADPTRFWQGVGQSASPW
jgi:L-cysteate sulfo-lyase